MVDDPEELVRYQVAFSLGEFPGPTKNPALTTLACRNAGIGWLELAIRSSLHDGTGAVLANLARDADYTAQDGGMQFLKDLAAQIGQQQRADDLAVVFRLFKEMSESERRVLPTIVTGLGAQSGSPLAAQLSEATAGRFDDFTRQLLADAVVTIQDSQQPDAQRIAGIQLLTLGSLKQFQELFTSLLDPEQPPAIQAVTIETLGIWREDTAPLLLIDRWPSLSPALRSQASEILFSRPQWISLVLDAMETQAIAVSDFQPARLQQMASHRDPDIRDRAASLEKNLSRPDRNKVLEKYRSALQLEPDPARGKVVFQKNCVACHRLEEVGHDLGPSLLTVRNRSAETILYHVLAPNREVDPKYLNYLVFTQDGRTLTGTISAETATSITLKRSGQESDTILRKDIDELRSTGLSLMPEGLEKQIDRQAMADLIDYISRAKASVE